MRPCAQEPDPAQCEAKRKELRAHYMAARDACRGKERAGREPCIAQQMCAGTPDPAKCMASAKERKERRRETHDKVPPKT